MATTDLNTSIQFLKDRADATLAVQKQIATAWLWPVRTVAEWEADSAALDKSQDGSTAALAIDAATAADKARGALDARMTLLHTQTLQAVGVMRVRAQRDAALLPVVDELSARGDSRKTIEDEATALLSAWKTEFQTSFIPAPNLTYESFRKLLIGDATATPPLPSLRDLKQNLSDAATVDRKKGGTLGGLLLRVEKDAQDWYAEATSVFAEGTENGNLIRTIPTTSTYNPPTAAPAIPPAVPTNPA